MTDSGISIELTRMQVNQIVRGASEEDSVSILLRGLSQRGTFASQFRSLSESPRLSRSLLLGLLVLACFPTDGDALAVTDVAERLRMSPSTTHRYMTTLLAVGILEQDPRSRRYRVPLIG
jgi:DNA-binding MarR family transcriptional regulator